MGDRCSLHITVRRADRDIVTAVMGAMELELESVQTLDLYDPELNYGGYSLREELAQLRVPFYGNHDAGGDYGPCAFCSTGNLGHEEWPVDFEGRLVVALDDTGQVEACDLERARGFVWDQAMAVAVVQGSVPLEPVAPIPPHRQLVPVGALPTIDVPAIILRAAGVYDAPRR
jgi:hypothetical protein